MLWPLRLQDGASGGLLSFCRGPWASRLPPSLRGAAGVLLGQRVSADAAEAFVSQAPIFPSISGRGELPAKPDALAEVVAGAGTMGLEPLLHGTHCAVGTRVGPSLIFAPSGQQWHRALPTQLCGTAPCAPWVGQAPHGRAGQGSHVPSPPRPDASQSLFLGRGAAPRGWRGSARDAEGAGLWLPCAPSPRLQMASSCATDAPGSHRSPQAQQPRTAARACCTDLSQSKLTAFRALGTRAGVSHVQAAARVCRGPAGVGLLQVQEGWDGVSTYQGVPGLTTSCSPG